ncbi:MAG: LPS assembly lipoprotein LptE [Candidatus Sedimenticola endophacoides]
MSKRIIQLGLAAGLLMLLQGCGFHLRGDVALPATISPLRIDGIGRYHGLYTELSLMLRGNGIQVAGEGDAARSRLRISGYKSRRRTLSVDGSGNVIEYELHEGATFELRDDQGNERVAAQPLSLTRSYNNNGSQALGKQDEENTIRREMQRDLAQRILSRLQAQL